MENAMTEMMTGINLYTLLALMLWSIPWKAWAMWLAARRGDFWWFLAFLVVNTVGILEIVYIFFIAKESDKRPDPTREKKEGEESPDGDNSRDM